MHSAFLGLGANLGERLATLRSARRDLASHSRVEIADASPLYETAPVGGPPGQGLYLNAVLQLNTTLAPRQLLVHCQSVEERHGRRRQERWGARTLDIDLLLYDDLLWDEADLQLPHPRLHLRRFVLAPLADLAPRLPHPRLGETIGRLLDRARTDETVSLLREIW